MIRFFLILSLFITGGHLVDTNFGLHHYSDEDYKEIFHLKNKKSTSKECIKHSELEDIKKITHGGNNGVQEIRYIISKNDVLEKVEKKDGN